MGGAQVERLALFDLDGRNRYRACEELGIEPDWEMYEGDDPVAYVISANLKRWHLSTSQRAMIAEKLANLQEGRPEKTAGSQAVSQSDAAKKLKVSRDSVQKAKKVRAEAEPEVIEAVEKGEVNLSTAAELAKVKRPPSEQRSPPSLRSSWRHSFLQRLPSS